MGFKANHEENHWLIWRVAWKGWASVHGSTATDPTCFLIVHVKVDLLI